MSGKKTEHVRRAYDASAAAYDRARRQLVPDFDGFYDAVGDALYYHGVKPRRVLDLGSGTGLLAERIADRFPSAELLLADLSAPMLEQASVRFAQAGRRADTVCLDYAEEQLPGGFDAIVSAISIHHVDDDAKRSLFRKIFQALEPGGIFVNADQVLAPNPELHRQYHQNWLDHVLASGIRKEDLDAALERMKVDRLSTLAEQSAWLVDAGFVDVDCWYKRYSLAVYGGRRPAGPRSI